MSFPCLSLPGEDYLAIGLMSGTSLDGIDAALLTSDGGENVRSGEFVSFPYEAGLRARLRDLLGARPGERENDVAMVTAEVTEAHGNAVAALLQRAGVSCQEVDVIGFHGQTINHNPAEGWTWQIGDGALLAALTGINVIDDFRRRDMANGGEGAPLAPLYHAALLGASKRPFSVLNIGGVANLTWLGAKKDEIIAFDTGPGNALMDDWAYAHTGRLFDQDGALAAAGTINPLVLAGLLAHPFFDRTPPKSLDRNDFSTQTLAGLSPQDGAATLCAFTVHTIVRGLAHLPARPTGCIVTGGGRLNPVLMAALGEEMAEIDLIGAEAAGWNGDALEAEAFAYLAIRSLCDLPISLPSTTGVRQPTCGGTLHKAPVKG
ncbi:MAG: anhydro-N-acetylmuramic acid kinase [Rhodospirillaceae bacterium]|nr:anhydro-N-acetylmuramic acid kinase [Rhodospirillaceae bacterium]MBT5374248.1 anhydro-N-acetylmuramic acid kinase [Rhodospirillaceae bacterium]MBT5751670.1 anhydro-N-acetylmuramic acid kinase [Rhodospirillaceae bacterium]